MLLENYTFFCSKVAHFATIVRAKNFFLALRSAHSVFFLAHFREKNLDTLSAAVEVERTACLSPKLLENRSNLSADVLLRAILSTMSDFEDGEIVSDGEDKDVDGTAAPYTPLQRPTAPAASTATASTSSSSSLLRPGGSASSSATMTRPRSATNSSMMVNVGDDVDRLLEDDDEDNLEEDAFASTSASNVAKSNQSSEEDEDDLLDSTESDSSSSNSDCGLRQGGMLGEGKKRRKKKKLRLLPKLTDPGASESAAGPSKYFFSYIHQFL